MNHRFPWEAFVILILSVIGWLVNIGVITAHLDDTRDRVQRLEQKVDYLLMEERKNKS